MENIKKYSGQILFASMGMFIIDEIHFKDDKVLYNVIGGAGTFAAYGARYFLPAPASKSVGWIVDAGSDFPLELKEQLFKLDTTMIFREDKTRLTTRGWNGYGENEFRQFRYQTEKKRITIEDMINSPLLGSRTFHLICSPGRASNLVTSLAEERHKRDPDLPEPIIVWEPVPDNCTPEHLQACYAILPQIDILSPNVAEAAAFFGLHEPSDPAQIEQIGSRFLKRMRKDAAVIIRAGEMGCLVLSNVSGTTWLQSYHKGCPEKVVDPTGAGNAFVGAMCIGYILSEKSHIEAAIYGNIAASLSIEQVGVAEFSRDAHGELWNGSTVSDRLAQYRARLA
ncbi:Ribokinase-like protein [Lipomyces oligophaga]|uniref:Ribokinase-like protein n=1 Tax=Lipomyces oligophaga TaxID=45792 RepID=UPI0034CFEC39